LWDPQTRTVAGTTEENDREHLQRTPRKARIALSLMKPADLAPLVVLAVFRRA